MSRPTDLAVMDRLSALDRDIRMCPDVLRAKKVRAGTEVTIGVPGDVVGSIFSSNLIVALYMVNREQFLATRREMELEALPAAPVEEE